MMPQPRPAHRHLFVYGTLRRGASNDINGFSPSPRWLGAAEVDGVLYDLGAYPGVVLGGAGIVKGEVYRIAPALEAVLDLLEEVAADGSGEYIKRELRVRVGTRWIDCLVYELHPGRIADRPVIASGDWLARF